MAELNHFDMIPLHFDSQRKVVSSIGNQTRALVDELDALNSLHRSIVSLETPSGVPPPPIPVHPKLAAMVDKLNNSGSAKFREGSYAEAARMYTLACQMAFGRPLWEPEQLVRDDVSRILSNRAQARMSLGDWPGGAVDAETSVEARRTGNAKAWWRRGKCLMEMGRIDESLDWVQRSLEIENDKDLVALGKEIEDKLSRQKEGKAG